MSATLDRVLFEERHRTAADAWGKEHPPADGAAEAALLNLLLIAPERMGTLNIRDRLCMPEQRTIWQAMSRVWMRDGLAGVGDWWIAIRRELHVLACSAKDACHETECRGGLLWHVLMQVDQQVACVSDLDYWLERLDRCVEARRLIEAAQFQAACAWRGDVDGARLAAQRSAAVKRDPGIEIPV